MDNVENRLKQDAERIRADVSPQLRSRIDASLRGTAPVRPERGRRDFSLPLWLGASLSGAVAAVLIIVLVNRDIGDFGQPRSSGTLQADNAALQSVPEYVRNIERRIPLNVETADLTAPLEEELEDLQADLEKARKDVERDLDFTF